MDEETLEYVFKAFLTIILLLCRSRTPLLEPFSDAHFRYGDSSLNTIYNCVYNFHDRRVREELMQQLMGLALNQDSDVENDYSNSDNENNDSEEEDDEEVVEDLDDDEDNNNYEGEEEFEWYDWPDQSKLATLDNLPDGVVDEEMVDTEEQISLDYLRNPALDSDQEDDEEEVENVVTGEGGGVGGDGTGNTPDQVPAQGKPYSLSTSLRVN